MGDGMSKPGKLANIWEMLRIALGLAPRVIDAVERGSAPTLPTGMTPPPEHNAAAASMSPN